LGYCSWDVSPGGHPRKGRTEVIKRLCAVIGYWSIL
jgi:hypothetical protein